MKLKFPKLKAAGQGAQIPIPHSALRTPHSERGIALVITLIMISVIAFMAITFLVLSQRERGSVSVIASQTDARLAAETALQTATAKLLAPIIAYTNPFNYDLLVSTNYINPVGFNLTPAVGDNPFTNVNYGYTTTGAGLTPAQQMQNIANLLYDPRPPVFITNRAAGSNDFRYYLDLNRNGRPDTNGLLPVVVDNAGNTNGLLEQFVGDPEWVGILERPELPHSSSNKFIARYAYIAVPTGKTLDLNFIHNYAKRRDANMAASQQDSFLRNQGVGSWEINLGAFLTDLNANYWNYAANSYSYDTNNAQANRGAGFDDALSLLRYRYNGDENALASADTLFSNHRFKNDNIDEYADGQMMSGSSGIDENLVSPDATALSWPGADNINHFFTTQDLFDANKTAIGISLAASNLTTRLLAASAQTNSYDRYTYYRLLSQMGTDSAAEQGKINLNYRNVTNGVIVSNLETNFYAWTPLDFFTNVADRLLLNLTNEPEFSQEFSNRLVRVTNIMIWPTNDYTPAVHRILQVAANLYDATTNHFPLGNGLSAPSVFRPVFNKTATNVVIARYEEVADASITNATMRDLNSTNDMTASWGTNDMVYGFPLVIGAKKGFPNFNALALQTAVRATRKLQLYRPNTNSTPTNINQMYLLAVSNSISVAAWNSYANPYPLAIRIIAAADVTVALTNENGTIQILGAFGSGLASNRFSSGFVTNLNANTWQGFDPEEPPVYSFRVPIATNFWSLTNASWQSAAPASSLGFFNIPPATNFNQQGLTPPHWWMTATTRLRFIMVDTSVSPNRILDYVNLSSDAEPLNITQELMHGTDCDNNPGGDNSAGGAWCTNKPATYPPYTYVPTYGILSQIGVSRGSIGIPANSVWKSYIDDPTTGNDVAKSIQNFSAFMAANPGTTNLVMQAPFSPFRTIYQYVSWQVNDPLVHYMVQDLADLLDQPETRAYDDPINSLIPTNVTSVAKHYRPWGGRPKNGSETTPATDYQLQLKDPAMWNSDSWDFPTNKLSGLGSLGRVHRGTPWQTLYLKSATVDTNTWIKWTGNTHDNDSVLAQPQKDWHIFDLFTTAPNANATRGQLPINQPGLAAWSAALSGVLVLSNNAPDDDLASWGTPPYAAFPIDPAGMAGTNSPVQRIVDGINAARASTNYNKGSFRHLGDILSVPELSTNSPFLNLSTAAQVQKGIGDAAYERIPQQILSLLRLGDQPRFVIYAYGQSLKPADRSIVQTSGYSGLCTNYQITGETAIRAVLRVEGVAANDTNAYNPRVVIESYNNLPPD